ncbi:hypothetical protein [Algoriphagus sp. AK58]|uniref:hypothetical protein n=1 Tax=Algoriphagus sp. AK58 TaxID=1406877 RepID=UPI00164FFACA|nr:hypothetical protein [Algoriphagus sp. AK58]MBC6369083.1 hypothetical protein [Algoriphagus sp. AK58]
MRNAYPRYFSFLGFFLLLACSEEEKPKGESEVFWVYSYTFPCDPNSTAAAPCLGITYSEELDFDVTTFEWIPSKIEGYTFKPNYIQKLQVLKFEDSKTREIKRKLVRVIEEERDYYDLLEGSWKVKRYKGEDLPNPSFPNGQSVGIIPGIRFALSTDGCNQIEVQLKKIEQNKILSTGYLRTTAMDCGGRKLVIPFPWTRNFKREGNLLIFYDDSVGEYAIWEKMN